MAKLAVMPAEPLLRSEVIFFIDDSKALKVFVGRCCELVLADANTPRAFWNPLTKAALIFEPFGALGVPARFSAEIALSASVTALPMKSASVVFAAVRLVILPESTASAFVPSRVKCAWKVESAVQNFGAHCAAGTVLACALVEANTVNDNTVAAVATTGLIRRT